MEGVWIVSDKPNNVTEIIPPRQPLFQDSGDVKLAACIKVENIAEPVESTPPDFVLLGLPLSKSSISFSGAHDTPRVFRDIFGGFHAYHAEKKVDLSEIRWTDVGNAKPHVTDIIETQRKFDQACRMVYQSYPQSLPIFIGGDHSISASTLRALCDTSTDKSKIGVIQFDAHHDVRNVEDGGPSNGTPFRQLIEGDYLQGEQIVQIGIRNFSNSRTYAEYAVKQGIQVYSMRNVYQAGIVSLVEQALWYFQEKGLEQIYVTVDMDVLDQAFAPGVPALGPGGLSSYDLISALERLGQEQNIKGIDFVCIDPYQDPRHMTVRVAAFALLHFCTEQWLTKQSSKES
jgi:formiminoglutamase